MKNYNLKPKDNVDLKHTNIHKKTIDDITRLISEHSLFKAAVLLTIVICLGEVATYMFKSTGIIVPDYVGTMIIATIIRNMSDYTSHIEIDNAKITAIGNMTLRLFLAIVLMQINFISMISMAPSIPIILFCQVVLMA